MSKTNALILVVALMTMSWVIVGHIAQTQANYIEWKAHKQKQNAVIDQAQQQKQRD